MVWGQALKNWGKLGGYFARRTATGKYGGTAAGALWGGVAGGAWGAVSDDTSVLGGMGMGAALGAGAGRYGAAGLRRGMLGRRGIGVGGAATRTGTRGFLAGAGRGIYNRARMDYRGARLMGNRAMNGFSAMTRGIAPIM